MRKFVIFAGVLGSLALPVSAQATETPGPTERKNAAQECRFERGKTTATREAFALKYGTNANRANAFGKCVSAKAKELKRQADAQDRTDAKARQSAARRCDQERGTSAAGQAAFTIKYGTGKRGRNAFGKCVSTLAKTIKADAQHG